MRPLEGIKVIDLSTVVMGPYASQLLADYGADVIKIESPDGDSTRRTGPSREEGMSAIFLSVNRSKKSVVLDLKKEEGVNALLRLVDDADVFIHSMRPQKIKRLGLAHEVLCKRNPGLVYAGMHGFAENGPYGGKPAYDDIIQGLSGLAALMELQNGEPQYMPTVAADKISGLYAATAILAAVCSRERTGKGSFVEVPMFESMVSFVMIEHLFGHQFNPPLADFGYPRVLASWRRPHKTKDGYLCVMPYTDKNWRDLFLEAGELKLANDPRFANIGTRTDNIAALYTELARIMGTRSNSEWLETCNSLEIPAAPVNRMADILKDPHLDATNFFQEYEDPEMGKLRFPGVPVFFDGERMPITPPPRKGEHAREILADAGLSEQEIERILFQAKKNKCVEKSPNSTTNVNEQTTTI